MPIEQKMGDIVKNIEECYEPNGQKETPGGRFLIIGKNYQCQTITHQIVMKIFSL
jgi:hypothetical protein